MTYFATFLVWYVVFVAVFVGHVQAFHTQFCFQGARSIVDACMDHTTVVSTLVSRCV